MKHTFLEFQKTEAEKIRINLLAAALDPERQRDDLEITEVFFASEI